MIKINSLSLEDCYDLFLIDRESYCSEKTVKNYRSNLKYFLDYMADNRQCEVSKILMDSVTDLDLKTYVVYLRNKPKYYNHPYTVASESKIKKRSIRTYCIDLRTFLNFCRENDYCDSDILSHFKLIKAEQVIKMPLSQAEVDLIDKRFNMRTFVGLRNYIMFHLMIDCGFRDSDVMNLKVSDCDTLHKVIVVRNGKGSKDRVVPFPSNLRKAFILYSGYLKKYTPECDNLLVCVGTEIKPLTYNAIKMVFARMKKTSGVSRIYPHLCRHTFATSYILGGGDISMLQILMGHSSISTTEGYLHLAQQMKVCNYKPYSLDSIYYKRFE